MINLMFLKCAACIVVRPHFLVAASPYSMVPADNMAERQTLLLLAQPSLFTNTTLNFALGLEYIILGLNRH